MEEIVSGGNNALLEAKLARWVVQLSYPITPAHMSHALEAFKGHWRLRQCLLGDREHMKQNLLLIFRDIPEIVSWCGRRDNPVALELLATMVVSTAWVDPYLVRAVPPAKPWRRFWQTLGRAVQPSH